MRNYHFYILLSLLNFCASNHLFAQQINTKTMYTNQMEPTESGYNKVNGLSMYYEIYGEGMPLVIIHGGGSTINSNFGTIIPLLAKNRRIIAMELQAHGRTKDRGTSTSFEQDADDVATLLVNLGIEKADVLGFSNGGTTAMQVCIRHPHMVRRLILCSTLAKRHGMPDGFWEFMAQASLENMPMALQSAYLDVNPNQEELRIMHDRDAARMQAFKDIPDELIASIKAPTLIINADKDVVSVEHAFELNNMIAGSKVFIATGQHGGYLGEITTITEQFRPSDLCITEIEAFLEE